MEAYLDDLERRIDDGVETALWNEWRGFYEGRGPREGVFAPCRPRPAPPRIPWPEVSVNRAFEDPEAMVYQQLKGVSDTLAGGGGSLLNVRCNYSTAILPTLFGARVFMMDPELNTLPTSLPLEGGVDAIRAVVDRGAPDIRAALGGRCFETAARFREALGRRPKVRKHVRLYHPDLQGPLDVCELLWGSALFLAAYDEADLLHALLRLVEETYRRFMEAWAPFERPEDGGYTPHWGLLVKGRIMLRDDSAMNFSPGMVEEFILPYDGPLLERFGGCVHFCGRGDHYLDKLVRLGRLSGIQLSQPECNDMDRVLEHTVEQGVPLLGFSAKAAQDLMARGRNLRGRVQVWR